MAASSDPLCIPRSGFTLMLASLAMIRSRLMQSWASARHHPGDSRASTRMALQEAEYRAERLAAKARLIIVVLFGAQIVAASLGRTSARVE
jgi:hypothetical protein